MLDRQPGIGLTQEVNDLFLGALLLHRSDLHLGVIGLWNHLLRIPGGQRIFGSLKNDPGLDGTVPIGPDCVPAELAMRSQVLSTIERTEFGEWKPPPSSLPGWYGPYLQPISTCRRC